MHFENVIRELSVVYVYHAAQLSANDNIHVQFPPQHAQLSVCSVIFRSRVSCIQIYASLVQYYDSFLFRKRYSGNIVYVRDIFIQLLSVLVNYVDV